MSADEKSLIIRLIVHTTLRDVHMEQKHHYGIIYGLEALEIDFVRAKCNMPVNPLVICRQ